MQLPKIVAMGIYDSRIVKPNVAVSQNRKVTMFEIELPIEAAGVTYLDSVSSPIKTNMLICAKPGQVRHTKFPYKCFYIHAIVPQGLLQDILMKVPMLFETGKPEVYHRIFSEMLRHYSDFSEKEDLMIQSKMLELIYTVSNDTTLRGGVNGTGNSVSVIEKTITYIDEHLTEDLSLEALAKLNSLSAIHFHNTFKSATGKTLRNYVEEQRIKKAINLLYTTNYNLTRIAYECGFSSQSYFSFAFKRKMNCTPREYIKKLYHKYEL